MRLNETIYLDYQASTPVAEEVSMAMQACRKATFANPHATQHHLGREAARITDTSREII
jgi:cysteine desulfurase